MRTIKFRGKSLLNKKWEQGSLVVCNNGRQFITELFEVNEDSWLYWEVDPATVGQFTGLTNKNGKEIYEGDIVRVAEYDNMLMHEFTGDESRFEIFDIEEAKGGLIRNYTTVISWEVGAFVFSSNGKYNDTLLACLFGDMRRSNPIFEIEIIGNIHDNPE